MAIGEIRMPEMYLKKIEKVIGAIDSSDGGKFASYQEVDGLTKFRIKEIYYQLDELKAESYLKFVLSKQVDRSYIFSFLFDVIIDDMDQNEWEREKETLSSSARD
ncbi:MAG TPA: hypothetical protein VL995_14270 [Cellvibrio sp.]|nr:hypothetical protein [Cellvibrio sp.]